MKIRITDLLDQYYDDTVKLDEPQFHEDTRITPISPKKKYSMHKPLLIAASLLLVLCGVFVLNLGIADATSGAALAEGDASALLESLPESFSSEIPAAESALEDSMVSESVIEENSEEPAYKPETNADSKAYDPDEVAEHQLLVAELNLPLELDGEDGILLNLTLDMTYGDYIWYYQVPSLYEAYTTSYDFLHDETYQASHTAWDNAFLDAFWRDAQLIFSDGSSITLGSGDVWGCPDDAFSSAGSFVNPAEYAGIDLNTAYPAAVIICDETYEFTETTAMMTDPTPTLDTPEEALPDEVEIQQDITGGVIYGNGTETYPAAEDTNCDGIFTAALNINYPYLNSSASLGVFTLNPDTGEYTWYDGFDTLVVLFAELFENPTSEDFGDAMGDLEFSQTYLDWSNYTLHQYKSNAYLVFTDGTKVCLGCGDKVGFADEVAMFYDTGKLSWLEGDYNIDLSGLEPAYLEVCGDKYELY